MVLCAQPFVVIHLIRQMSFVTTGAEFCRLVIRLEQGVFVECRFGFDQLVIDRFQQFDLRQCKWVTCRRRDGEIAVPLDRVDCGDRMAGGAGQPDHRRCVGIRVEIDLFETATQ